MADRASKRTGGTIPVVSVAEGDFVFRTGDAAGSFYVIQSGQMELLRRGGEAPERLALLEAGDLFGEDSAFEGRNRACDARAITRSIVLEVDAELFTRLVRVRPDLAARVIGRVGLRLMQARAACLAMVRPGRTGTMTPPSTRPVNAASAGPSPAEPAATGPRLVHVESGRVYPIPPGVDALVGRADPRTPAQPDIELSAVDAQRSLSRRHATISRRGAEFFVTEEPRVANGTSVNGQRLTPGVAVALKDGDEVCFGLIKTIFHLV